MINYMENVIRGYKVADSNGQCRGYQFEVGKRYKHAGDIKICESGFHFCIKASHCFSYYSFTPDNKVFEVIGYGDSQTKGDDSKVCVGEIEIVRELTWQEVLVVSNEGKNNTGHSNSGNYNSGYYNSGNSNSGHSNSGDRNSGDRNIGDRNIGNYNSGDRNIGDRNIGNYNSGDRNIGYRNSGNYNSGDRNSGYYNSGNYNSGDRNSGYYNSGNSNSGNYNSGDRNSGMFNSNTPNVRMFNKESNWTWANYFNSNVYRLMNNVTPCIWVEAIKMSDEEKGLYPNFENVGGYIKVITLQESWVNLWGTLSNDDKEEFYKLPNFDWDIFTEITSIVKD
jgi:Pentapeptide repeats (8 copies)